jgi:hypothetical protein
MSNHSGAALGPDQFAANQVATNFLLRVPLRQLECMSLKVMPLPRILWNSDAMLRCYAGANHVGRDNVSGLTNSGVSCFGL